MYFADSYNCSPYLYNSVSTVCLGVNQDGTIITTIRRDW